MTDETDLVVLLQNLQPSLDQRPFVFCSVDWGNWQQRGVSPIGTFQEPEGLTLILEEKQAKEMNFPYTAVWALITLKIHSSLTAVGLLAAITAKLADSGISVNAVSAFYHDHLFVPWEERNRALAVLED